MIEFTAKEQAKYDETIATLEACNFTVTVREGKRGLLVQAVTNVADSSVNLTYDIQRPNVRLLIKGYGLTAAGRTVHLKDEAAIRTFARRSQQHGS